MFHQNYSTQTRRLLASFAALLFGLSQTFASALAQTASMDLQSTHPSETAPALPGAGINIRTGEQSTAVAPGAALTPAQLVAVNQLLVSGRQSIVINSQGAATGGSFSVMNGGTIGLGSLVIPQGVKALVDFTSQSNLRVAADVNNAGNLVLFSTNNLIKNATLDAANIINQPSGVIESLLANLALNATQNIVNNGSITSTGNLALTAGGSITNAPTLNSTANAPVIQSQGNLNLNAAQIINAGVMSSLTGNLNVSAMAGSDIVINNMGGTLEALAGAVNVRDQSYSGAADITILGGNVLARTINLNAGTGAIKLDVDDLAGTLNTTGEYAHIGTSSDLLELGNICITGDPTFFNSAGDIAITGNIQVAENLAIIASGDVKITNPAVSLIQARGENGQGYDIRIVAGAAMSGGTNSTTSIGDTPPVSGNATSAVTITGASATGGTIDFTASPNLNINANSTCASCSGGDVDLVAFANGTNGGRILLPTQTSNTALGSEINTSGNGTGTAGNVQMIAGAISGVAITTGKITAEGSSTDTSSGWVRLSTSQPTFGYQQTSVTFGPDGAIQNDGRFSGGGINVNDNASVEVTGSIRAPHSVSIEVGSNIFTPMNVVGTFEAGAGPSAIAFNPAGTFAYIANSDGGTVSVVRTSDNSIVATVPVGSYTRGLAVSPDGAYVYASNWFSHNVSVIRTSDNTVVATIPVGEKPRGIAFNPTGSLVYVTNWNNNSVSVISTATNAVVDVIPVGSYPWDVAISPDGTKAYVVNTYGNSVSVIDTATGTVTKTVLVGSFPFGVTFNPNGQFAYVVNSSSGTVSVIDVWTDTTVSAIPVGNNPLAVTVNPSGTLAYVTNAQGWSNDGVSIVRLSDNQIIQKVPAFNPDTFGNFVGFVNNDVVGYVGDRQSPGTISVLRMPAITSKSIDASTIAGDVNLATHGDNVRVRSREFWTSAGNISVTQTGGPMYFSGLGKTVNVGNIDSIFIDSYSSAKTFFAQANGAGSTITGHYLRADNTYISAPGDVTFSSWISGPTISIMSREGSIKADTHLDATWMRLSAGQNIGTVAKDQQLIADYLTIYAGGSVYVDLVNSTAAIGSGLYVSGVVKNDIDIETNTVTFSIAQDGLTSLQGNINLSSANALKGPGVITAKEVKLFAQNDLGMSDARLRTNTGKLDFQTNGSAYLWNHQPVTASGTAAYSFNLDNSSGSITIAPAGLTATVGNATVTAALEIFEGGWVSGDVVSLRANGGNIGTASSKLLTSANSLSLTSTGSTYVSNFKPSSLPFPLPIYLKADVGQNIDVNSSGTLSSSGNITANGAIKLSANSITVNNGHTVRGYSVEFAGLTANGTGDSQMTVLNSGLIQAAWDDIDIRTAAGQDLRVTSNGTNTGVFRAPAGREINFIATDNPDGNHPNITFSGSQNVIFDGAGGAVKLVANGSEDAFVKFTGTGTVVDFATPGTKITFDCCNVVMDNGGMYNAHANQVVLNCPTGGGGDPPGPLVSGTIARTDGADLDLSTLGTLSFPGLDLAIVSSGNIVSNGSPRTISLANTSGEGGNLLLIAGFHMTPGVSGVAGPNSTEYTLVSSNTSGGGILLGNVNIDTSGTTDGGTVSIYATRAIELGDIKTTGGASQGNHGGALIISGNGVATGAIRTGTIGGPHIDVSITNSIPKLGEEVKIKDGVFSSGRFWFDSAQRDITIESLDAGMSRIQISGRNVRFSQSNPVANFISIHADGTLYLPTNRISPTLKANGDGGTVQLAATSLSYAGDTNSPFTVDVSSPTGNGGNAGFYLHTTQPVTVGTAPKDLAFEASGISAGQVSVAAGGNLTINPGAINAKARGINTNGGARVFEAGTLGPGKLLIKGDITALGGGEFSGGGWIELISNSTTPFLIKNAGATNGVRGTILAKDMEGSGHVSITNRGGGITSYQKLTGLSTLRFDTAQATNGPIRLIGQTGVMGGTLEITSSGAVSSAHILQAPQIYLGSKGAHTILRVNTDFLSASSDKMLFVTSVGKNPLVLGELDAGTSLTVRASGSLSLTDAITAGTSVSIQTTAGNTINVGGGTTITANNGDIWLGVGTKKNQTGPFPAGAQYLVNGASVAPASPPFYFGAKGIDAGTNPSNVTFSTVNKGKIIFNTGTAPASAIHFDSAAGPIQFFSKVSAESVEESTDEFIIESGEDAVYLADEMASSSH